MAIQTVSGILDIKRLAFYLKKSHKERGIHVHKVGDGTLIITDKFILVRVRIAQELSLFVPVNEGTHFYPQGEIQCHESDKVFVDGWYRFHQEQPIATLRATRMLYENPHWKGASEFYRKLFYTDEDGTEYIVWMDKAFLDLFSTDPDDLDGFILELIEGNKVRVSCRDGITAYIMTATNIYERM